jgi:phage terminase large subunit-like protein
MVLTCPTTVLVTGPVCEMMKNWDMLIKHAKNPDYGAVSAGMSIYGFIDIIDMGRMNNIPS